MRRSIRTVPFVLVALGSVACTALLGDFSVGGGTSSGNVGEGGSGEGGSGEGGALGISPADVKVGVLRAQLFTATEAATWSVQEGPAAGFIDDTGRFLAADKPQVVRVIATSKSDPTKTATATVTIAPLGISILGGANGGEGNIDGPTFKAHFKQPGGIAHLFDSGGGERYFIADSGNHTIRGYDAQMQKVTTIAGAPGTSGTADGVGAAARFKNPSQMIADRKRNTLYVVDSDGTCIRQVDPATKVVTTVGGTCGLTGNGDGGAGVPAGFSAIRSIDVNGGKFFNEDVTSIFVCDSGNRIRKLALPGGGAVVGTTTTVVNTTGCELATDQFSGGQPKKNVYYLDQGKLWSFTDSPPYTSVFVGSAPETYTPGIGIGSGQGPTGLYMLSGNRSVIYRGDLTGAFDSAPLVGAFDEERIVDGPFATARIGRPTALDVITEKGGGSILFADTGAAAIRVADLGARKVSTLVGAARMVDRIDGPRSTARLTGPFSVASDPTGMIYFTDTSFDGPTVNNTIRKVDANGVVTTVAGKPHKPSLVIPPVDGTKDDATFGLPIDLVSLKGNLYVIDSFGQAVRKVTAAGDVTTLAGELGVAGDTTDAIGAGAHFRFSGGGGGGALGGGIATDGTDLFVCDTANFAIRKISAMTGQVTLLAGGTEGTANGIGKAAQFMLPFGLTFDNGFLYIADSKDHTIRRLDLKTNEVTGFIGLSGQLGEVDGDAGTALFHSPGRVMADGLGNLFVAEIPFNDNFFPGVIRRIDIKGRRVSPYAGMLGQIGLATGPLPSTLNCPLSFAITPQGDLAFADFCEASIAIIKPL